MHMCHFLLQKRELCEKDCLGTKIYTPGLFENHYITLTALKNLGNLQSKFFIFRYEYFNKGADLFVESLARLNHLLKVSFVLCCYSLKLQCYILKGQADWGWLYQHLQVVRYIFCQLNTCCINGALNLSNNNLYILSLVMMFPDKGFFTSSVRL